MYRALSISVCLSLFCAIPSQDFAQAADDIKESRDVSASHPEIARRVEEIMKSARIESEFWPAR